MSWSCASSSPRTEPATGGVPRPAPVSLLVEEAPRPGPWNMAVDVALAETAAARGAIAIRLYRWSPPCLSLGRNQPAARRYDRERLAAQWIDVVRRPSGGGAVYHDDELTYSISLPARALGGPRVTFRTVHAAITHGLRALGLPVEPWRGARRRRALSSAPCFAQAAEGELVVEGRKLVGSAQVRIGPALLQHGSILLGGDQTPAAALRARQRTAPPEADAASLERALGYRPEWSALVAALADGFRRSLAAPLVPRGLDAEERALAAQHVDRFRDPAWTWRR